MAFPLFYDKTCFYYTIIHGFLQHKKFYTIFDKQGNISQNNIFLFIENKTVIRNYIFI